ncbi:hypothetical protein [Dokdonia sp. Asnod1-B02]|uniref:hypothetical protein n=1 Tax=Dokdonia sp. Asnod1-B02 TaxID=3160573 RepID=UPI003865D7F3
MKKDKTHIIIRLTALFTMLVFLLPSVVSFSHSTADHEHYDTCKFTGEVHVHESKLDCDLGDLHVVKAGVYAFAKAYQSPIIHISKEVDVLLQTSYTTTILSSSDRGPPFC